MQGSPPTPKLTCGTGAAAAGRHRAWAAAHSRQGLGHAMHEGHCLRAARSSHQADEKVLGRVASRRLHKARAAAARGGRCKQGVGRSHWVGRARHDCPPRPVVHAGPMLVPCWSHASPMLPPTRLSPLQVPSSNSGGLPMQICRQAHVEGARRQSRSSPVSGGLHAGWPVGPCAESAHRSARRGGGRSGSGSSGGSEAAAARATHHGAGWVCEGRPDVHP